mgnify:CR=1 FL=1
MKKIFILITLMFLLVGCIESVALISGGAANGKLVQSSLQTVASYGVKKQTGKTSLNQESFDPDDMIVPLATFVRGLLRFCFALDAWNSRMLFANQSFAREHSRKHSESIVL